MPAKNQKYYSTIDDLKEHSFARSLCVPIALLPSSLLQRSQRRTKCQSAKNASKHPKAWQLYRSRPFLSFHKKPPCWHQPNRLLNS